MAEINHPGRFRVGDLTVDLTRREVHRGADLLPVKGLSFELLACLIRHCPSLASTRDINKEVWGDNVVSPAALGQRVKLLREALGPAPAGASYIGVVKSRGYRLLVPVDACRPGRQSRGKAPWSAAAVAVVALASAGIQTDAWERQTDASDMLSLQAYPSVWVQPFSTRADEPDAAYWVEGIRQEIIADLKQWDTLEVVAQNGQTDAEALARLQPDAVLHGEVSIAHGTVTLATRLSDPATKRDLWTSTYQVPLAVGALSAMQADISRQVARLVDPSDPSNPAAEPETRNTLAYEYFLRARYHAGQYNRSDMRKARELVDRAIEIDPKFAGAYELRAMIHSYSGTPSYGWLTPEEAFTQAREDALRALSLDPDRASALTVIGDILFWQEWNVEAAGRAFRRANELDPRDLGTLFSLAFFHSALGQHDASMGFIEQAIAIAPRNPRSHINAGWRLIEARRFEAAMTAAQTALDLDPGLVDAHRIHGFALSYLGRHQQALQAMARAGNDAAYGYTLAKVGRIAEATDIRDDLIARSEREFVYPGTIAMVSIAVGDHDAALFWLERAFDQRTRSLVHIRSVPLFDPLHQDPRFQDLARRVGLWNDRLESSSDSMASRHTARPNPLHQNRQINTH